MGRVGVLVCFAPSGSGCHWPLLGWRMRRSKRARASPSDGSGFESSAPHWQRHLELSNLLESQLSHNEEISFSLPPTPLLTFLILASPRHPLGKAVYGTGPGLAPMSTPGRQLWQGAQERVPWERTVDTTETRKGIHRIGKSLSGSSVRVTDRWNRVFRCTFCLPLWNFSQVPV